MKLFVGFFRDVALAWLFSSLLANAASAAVAPVGQLPSVTVSVTPSAYALPILLVEDEGEWKDFGIQVTLKVHRSGGEQLDRIPASDWDVGVMDPFYAVKGGNDADLAIVGVAGNFSSGFHILFRDRSHANTPGSVVDNLRGKKVLCPLPSAEHFWLTSLLRSEGRGAGDVNVIPFKEEDAGKAFASGKAQIAILRSPQAFTFGAESSSSPDLQRHFLPACLVATSNYADTRKTLVMRWAEGYSRGIRLIEKNPARAASRLKAFYRETLNLEIGEDALKRDLQQAFFFEDDIRHRALVGLNGTPGIAAAAAEMTEYLLEVKAIDAKKKPEEYIFGAAADQILKLRQEAEGQLARTRASIDWAMKEGASVGEFEKRWAEAREQLKDGRGCLTVIGVLSDLQRSSEQAAAATRRLHDFRMIELAVGLAIFLYYVGYFIRRRKKNKAASAGLEWTNRAHGGI